MPTAAVISHFLYSPDWPPLNVDAMSLDYRSIVFSNPDVRSLIFGPDDERAIVFSNPHMRKITEG